LAAETGAGRGDGRRAAVAPAGAGFRGNKTQKVGWYKNQTLYELIIHRLINSRSTDQVLSTIPGAPAGRTAARTGGDPASPASVASLQQPLGEAAAAAAATAATATPTQRRDAGGGGQGRRPAPPPPPAPARPPRRARARARPVQ